MFPVWLSPCPSCVSCLHCCFLAVSCCFPARERLQQKDSGERLRQLSAAASPGQSPSLLRVATHRRVDAACSSPWCVATRILRATASVVRATVVGSLWERRVVLAGGVAAFATLRHTPATFSRIPQPTRFCSALTGRLELERSQAIQRSMKE